jgi:putative DNA-invertase from lambdoid prophage Rac
LPQTYFYINGPSDRQFPEQELIRLDKAGYTVVLSRVAIDYVRPFIGTAGRPSLNALLRRVAPGDELVVLDLSCLGSSARDVMATLLKCRKERIAVRCVEFGNLDLAGRPESQAVKMLRAVVRLETATRSERSSTSLKLAQQNGRPTGRPGSLSPRDRGDVIGLLDQGVSVSEIARRFDTSRQTIMRIRASTATPVETRQGTHHEALHEARKRNG